MLDYLKRFLIAGIMALCVSLLFFGGKPQAGSLESESDWIWPTDGIISDTFGTRHGSHKGIDIAGSLNTSIFAVDDGIITKSYYSDTYGHVVFIKHRNNMETVYAHLNKRNVHEGQEVKKGQIIGLMGNTGKSYGVHLHFEIHKDEWTFEKENALNPAIVLGIVEIGQNVHALVEDNVQYVVKNIKPTEDTNVQKSIEEHGNKNTYVHIVKAGESLWSIAQEYSSTVEEIQRANSLENSQIYEKQALKVEITDNGFYEVKKGDTLSEISFMTNLTIEEIKKYNGMQSDDIYPLQKIKIPVK